MEPALIILIPLPALFLGWNQLCSSSSSSLSSSPALFWGMELTLPVLISSPFPSLFFREDGAGSALLHSLLPSPAFFGMELVLIIPLLFLLPYPFFGDGANSALPHPHPPFPALYGRDPGLIIFISLPFPSPLWDGASSALPSPLAQLFLGWSWLCSSSSPSPSSVFSGMEPTLIILIPVPFPSPLWEGSSSDHLYPPPLSQPFL